jgi:hypothetical protein
MAEREDDPGQLPRERILLAIYVIRGHRVMLDADLAALYGVETKALNQAVKRNIARFPSDFMFRLTAEEVAPSRSQLVTLNSAPEAPDENRAQRATPRGANVKYLPYAFTEQGVAMLSSVLRSPRAVQANIEIMRTFVQLRQALAGHEELSHKLDALEARYDRQFGAVFEALRQLMAPPAAERRAIGFTPSDEGPEIDST